MQIKLFGIFILALLAACSNGPDAAFEKIGPTPPIRADYKIWCEEGDSLVTVLLQFYSDAEKGKNLLLELPASVQIDGQPLMADSAGITGTYYELQAPLALFGGRHIIEFTYTDNRVFKDSFSFYPFSIAALPEVLTLKDYKLLVNGLPDGSAVRMVLTDTAAAGEGINETDKVKNSTLSLPANHLRSLKSGPVVLHLFAEEDRPLRSGLPGQLSVSYGLSRSFELQR